MDWPGGAESRHGSGFPAMPLALVQGRAASNFTRPAGHWQIAGTRSTGQSDNGIVNVVQ